jgi:hypothetical protein
MKQKLQDILDYALDRVGEASTWQGLAFFTTLAGAKWGANFDFTQAAASGAVVSGFIKVIFPDRVKRTRKSDNK